MESYYYCYYSVKFHSSMGGYSVEVAGETVNLLP